LPSPFSLSILLFFERIKPNTIETHTHTTTGEWAGEEEVVVLQIRSCVTLAPNKLLPLFSDFGGIFENLKIEFHRNFV
jgi:hypothetical protein